MAERIFAISYAFSPAPNPRGIRKTGETTYREEIFYNPTVVYNDGSSIQFIRSKETFGVSNRDIIENYRMFSEMDNSYREMLKRARAAQERIISEYICTIILDKARVFPEDDLTFLIRDEFQTEKIVGRLGYLGLPMDRLHIMFVSYDLTAFMSNYISPYSIPPQSDLKILFEKGQENNLWGPYPENGRISMLRTYYCSFSKDDLYPVRVNLFGQMLRTERFDQDKERIRNIFLGEKDMEVYPISGGRDSDKTRLPAILTVCEEAIKGELMKDE